ncbi:MAG: hypothetical protein J7K72_03290 [Candidatus Aenigmarchaeota archaeon]|nr:hypothetical protein [Candidatus Aenigmarchaeota archaeon]
MNKKRPYVKGPTHFLRECGFTPDELLGNSVKNGLHLWEGLEEVYVFCVNGEVVTTYRPEKGTMFFLPERLGHYEIEL